MQKLYLIFKIGYYIIYSIYMFANYKFKIFKYYFTLIL